MGIEIYKNGLHKFETGFIASSKVWLFDTRHRQQINLDDSAVTRYLNLVIVDMSAWEGFTSRADGTNYVRVVEHTDADESGTEINSQTVDYDSGAWSNGNHDAVVFLTSDTSTESTFTIYYGDIDLGAPGYTSDLTVTFNSPNAGDYTIEQDSYYKLEIDKNLGGKIANLWSRTSGGNILIGAANSASITYTGGKKAGTLYLNLFEVGTTITEIEGTVGANAGAVLVAFKCTGTIEDAANNPLQDDSAGDITFETTYIFCDCQLFQVIVKMIIADTVTLQEQRMLNTLLVDGYFSHQSYKYGVTHAVEILQDRDLGANWATKKYICFFDITSDDGFAIHFIDETIQNIEDSYLQLEEGAGQDNLAAYPDFSGDNDAYAAGTDTMTVWCQCDDFTAADGVNDADGDQPAHSKNTELDTALTQSITEDVMF